MTCYILMIKDINHMTMNAQRIWGVNAAATLETVQASWKMAKISLVMVVAFLAVWTAYAVVSFYAAFISAEAVPNLVAAIPALFAKTSTLFNPIIYFFIYKSFRESVAKLWRRYRFRKMIQPSSPTFRISFVVY